MDKVKVMGNLFEKAISDLPPWLQNMLAMTMAFISHLGTLTSIIAFVVILFQFKVAFLNGKIKVKELKMKNMDLKLKTLQYDKECIEPDE